MYYHSRDPFWARGSEWLIGAGLLLGFLAAAAGFIDFVAIKRARSLAAGWVHFIGNDLALLIAVANLWIRLDHPEQGVVPTGIVLSGLVCVIFSVTGWLGGELAFRHRIGMVER
jgi:uncharacterized membrane protein